MEDDVSYWEPLKKFYQVDDSFPAEQLLTRSDGEKKRNIYFVSDYVKQILANNDSEAVRVINAGVKIFMRSDQKKVGRLAHSLAGSFVLARSSLAFSCVYWRCCVACGADTALLRRSLAPLFESALKS
jgi:type III secretory pathway lipoprotein EscJ